jgi:hypothetical protein
MKKHFLEHGLSEFLIGLLFGFGLILSGMTDPGKVIGKRGVNADAMRRILHAIGGKVRRRYVLEVVQLPTAAPDGEALGADPVSA